MINYIFYDLFQFYVVGTRFVILRPESIIVKKKTIHSRGPIIFSIYRSIRYCSLLSYISDLDFLKKTLLKNNPKDLD